jgi:hypothetical protein
VYYKQYNYELYFVAKVSKLLALINYSYKNFLLGGVIKKVEAPKTTLLYTSLYTNVLALSTNLIK